MVTDQHTVPWQGPPGASRGEIQGLLEGVTVSLWTHNVELWCTYFACCVFVCRALAGAGWATTKQARAWTS